MAPSPAAEEASGLKGEIEEEKESDTRHGETEEETPPVEAELKSEEVDSQVREKTRMKAEESMRQEVRADEEGFRKIDVMTEEQGDLNREEEPDGSSREGGSVDGTAEEVPKDSRSSKTKVEREDFKGSETDIPEDVPVVSEIEDESAVGDEEIENNRKVLVDESDLSQGDSVQGEVSRDNSRKDGEGDTESEGPEEEEFVEVSPPALSAFVALLTRFHKRMIEVSSGRKYKLLRDAWEGAMSKAKARSDMADLKGIGSKILVALREGCESQKTVIVDCCLDFVLRLFEYKYLGSGEPCGGGAVVLDVDTDRLDEIIALVCGCLEVKEEEVYLRMVQTLLTAASSTKVGLHAGTLLAAVRTIYNIFLNAKTPGTRTTARVSLTQILSLVFQRMEAETAEYDSRSFTDEAQAGAAESDRGNTAHKGETFSSVLQKDAYLLFRALCKLSSKPISVDALPESVPSRSKLLSLQLLQSILASSGPAFRGGSRFIYALRVYLAPSLLQNALSPHLLTASVALDTIELLIVKETLRPVIRKEIAAIMTATLFRFASSPHSEEKRAKALQVLGAIAADRQALADLFLNYDCLMDSPSIFKEIMEIMASTAEGEWVQPDNRMAALAAVVKVVKSLRLWAEKSKDILDAGDVDKPEAVLEFKGRQGEAVSLFNAKPRSGIEYLIKKGSLRRDPEDVAKWLKTSKDLDKGMIGDYLGGAEEFNIAVMKAFVQTEKFDGLVFDAALRQFLSRFRLPGEAQKIDRIMESFAHRFCACNPGVFAEPVTAYVLAYSCIMLHTDAHNSSVKVKMTVEDFIRNNRGINAKKDLDPKFLQGLYKRITTNEFKLNGEEEDGLVKSTAAFNEESLRLLEKYRADFSLRKKSSTDATFEDTSYETASNPLYAKLMFLQTWQSILSTLSTLLERAPQKATKTISLSLSGFRDCVALTSEFNLPVQKSAFVSSLSRFTDLDSLSDFQAKNTECIRMILAIAALEGNGLEEQWLTVLQAISQVEHNRAIAANNPRKFALSKESVTSPSSASGPPLSHQTGKSRHSADSQRESKQGKSGSQSASHTSPNVANGISVTSSTVVNGTIPRGSKLHSQAATIAASIPEAEIERIFLCTENLSSTGFTDFLSALCTVSLSELTASTGPTVFSVQKLVETVSYNCKRRDTKTWIRAWRTLHSFFENIVALGLSSVSLYAVDIAKQLAQKWLEAEPRMGWDLQRQALRPFEPCFGSSSSGSNVAVRELVLQCISQIVLSKGDDLKGGWRSVFSVLTSAASDKEENIVVFGWQILERISRYNLSIEDRASFLEAVSTLGAYAQNSCSPSIANAAISHLHTPCASSLSDSLSDSSAQFSADVDEHIGAWFPILTGIAAAASDTRDTVRKAAYDGLFGILATHGARFSASLWHLIFRGVVSPMLDEVNAAEDSTAAANWVSKSGAFILRSLVDIAVRNSQVSKALLAQIIDLFSRWITHDTEIVAREGMSALSRLIKNAGTGFRDPEWDIVVHRLSDLFNRTMPFEILGPGSKDQGERSPKKVEPGDKVITSEELKKEKNEMPNEIDESDQSDRDGSKRKVDIQVVRAKCVVQLLLIQLVQDIVVLYYSSLSTQCMTVLAEALKRSYRFARDFNADIERRFWLWRTGFMNQVPNLLKQETIGVMTYLRVLLWLYLDEKRDASAVEESLFAHCEDVKRAFVEASENARAKPDEHKEVKALCPVILFILNGLMQLSEAQFARHLQGIYFLLLELMETSDVREVRKAIRELLALRIGPLLSTKADLDYKSSRFIPKPQIPGLVREVVLAIEGVELQEEAVAVDVQSAIERISGVKSAVVNTEERIARVYTSAPDELLVSTLLAGGKVKGANVIETPNEVDVLD